MTLVAKCPACETKFRVNAATLSVRNGQVRCGNCNTVFDALIGLSFIDETGNPTPSPGLATSPPTPPPVHITPVPTVPTPPIKVEHVELPSVSLTQLASQAVPGALAPSLASAANRTSTAPTNTGTPSRPAFAEPINHALSNSALMPKPPQPSTLDRIKAEIQSHQSHPKSIEPHSSVTATPSASVNTTVVAPIAALAPAPIEVEKPIVASTKIEPTLSSSQTATTSISKASSAPELIDMRALLAQPSASAPDDKAWDEPTITPASPLVPIEDTAPVTAPAPVAQDTYDTARANTFNPPETATHSPVVKEIELRAAAAPAATAAAPVVAKAPAAPTENNTAPVSATSEPAPSATAVTLEPAPELTAQDVAQQASHPAPAPDYSFMREKRKSSVVARLFFGTASILACLALAGQMAWHWRNELAATVPETQPYLAQACLYLKCTVGAPKKIQSLSIVSPDLRPFDNNKNGLQVSLVLRNDAAMAVAWPHVEITLTSANGAVVSRRSLGPDQYRSTTDATQAAIPAQAERPIRLVLDGRELNATDFRLDLFYP